jgi:selenoprotein W-related protein|tara:strand:+ start:8140 stop:8310 length:171 start_codon:yes stop_codon:yes gene_type:complete
LADELKKGVEDVNVEIVEGSGGVFEVTANGALIYSKKETGRFPEEGEILKSINETS